jgi:hypothetical protein
MVREGVVVANRARIAQIEGLKGRNWRKRGLGNPGPHQQRRQDNELARHRALERNPAGMKSRQYKRKRQVADFPELVSRLASAQFAPQVLGINCSETIRQPNSPYDNYSADLTSSVLVQ